MIDILHDYTKVHKFQNRWLTEEFREKHRPFAEPSCANLEPIFEGILSKGLILPNGTITDPLRKERVLAKLIQAEIILPAYWFGPLIDRVKHNATLLVKGMWHDLYEKETRQDLDVGRGNALVYIRSKNHLYAAVPIEMGNPDKFLIKRAIKNEPIETRLTMLLRQKLPDFFR